MPIKAKKNHLWLFGGGDQGAIFNRLLPQFRPSKRTLGFIPQRKQRYEGGRTLRRTLARTQWHSLIYLHYWSIPIISLYSMFFIFYLSQIQFFVHVISCWVRDKDGRCQILLTEQLASQEGVPLIVQLLSSTVDFPRCSCPWQSIIQNLHVRTVLLI